jgi:hypothetical protein
MVARRDDGAAAWTRHDCSASSTCAAPTTSGSHNRFQSHDFRLTDVHGELVEEMLD